MNSWIWIILLLGCCGNNGFGNGYGWGGNSCNCGCGCENHNHNHDCGCMNNNNNSCGGSNNCITPIQPRMNDYGCATPPSVPYYVQQDDCGCGCN